MKKLLGAGAITVLAIGTAFATPPGAAIDESANLEHSRFGYFSSKNLEQSGIGLLESGDYERFQEMDLQAQLNREQFITDMSQLKAKPGQFIDLPRGPLRDYYKKPEQSKALQEHINKYGQKLTMRQKCVATYQSIRDAVTPWIEQVTQSISSLWHRWF